MTRHLTSWITAAAISVCFLGSLLLVRAAGVGSRSGGVSRSLATPGTPAYVVAHPADVYRLWRAEGVHGRIVVHLSNAFGHAHVPTSIGEVSLAVSGPALSERLEAKLEDANFMWIAAQNGLVRHIVNVVPRERFARKAAQFQGASGDPKVASVSKAGIVVSEQGLRRTMCATPPELSEPVLVVIDASLFQGTTSAEALHVLEGVSSDLVVLCLAEGDASVGEDQRKELLKLAAHFEVSRVGR